MLSSSDLVYAFRTLRRSPVFTVAVVLSLAFGIGLNAAIFTIVNAVLLHPAGVTRPEQVVAPRISYGKFHLDRIEMSIPDFADVRNSREVFSVAAVANTVGLNYTNNDSPQRLKCGTVTWEWFAVFGANPLLGRGFQSEEDQLGSNHVAVLSFDLWTRSFGSQSSVVGQTIELDRKPYLVIGVMPSGFRQPNGADLWIPLALPSSAYAANHRFDEFYTVVARLQPHVSLAKCEAFMKVLTRRAKERDRKTGAYAEDAQWSMVVEPYIQLTAGSLKLPLLILSGALGLVLLIACSNIAGLILVRATSRSRELAVRAALGASTANLVTQALAESGLLAVGGTVLGLLSIPLLLNCLLFFAPQQLAAGMIAEPDSFVLFFTVSVGAVTSLLFGLAPALQAARTSSRYERLKEGGRSETEGRSRQRWRGSLVTGQVALALLLMIGAFLLLKTLGRLRSMNLGFTPGHVMTAAVELPDAVYQDDTKRTVFFRSVLEELKKEPGVIMAAAAEPVPFNGDHWSGTFEIEGRPSVPGDPGPHGYRSFVSPEYFQTIGTPLLSGRYFNAADRLGAQPVTLVDENLVRAYWPYENPIGKKIRNGSSSPWTVIVGVVKHIRAYDFAGSNARGICYQPIYQSPMSYMNFLVRTAGDPHVAAVAIRRAVHKQDRSVAVFDTATLEERISSVLGAQAFATELLTGFACVALFLATLGLYGVVSYSAGQRRKEIGIRAALGASRWQVISVLAGGGLRVTLIGIIAGAFVAALLVRTLSPMAENVSLDGTTILIAALLLGLVALLATVLPAWRATAVNPLSALRDE